MVVGPEESLPPDMTLSHRCNGKACIADRNINVEIRKIKGTLSVSPVYEIVPYLSGPAMT
jgi:hypothetical protein